MSEMTETRHEDKTLTNEGTTNGDGTLMVLEQLFEGVGSDLSFLDHEDDLFIVEQDGTSSAVEDLDARLEVARSLGDAVEGDECDGRRREFNFGRFGRGELLLGSGLAVHSVCLLVDGGTTGELALTGANEDRRTGRGGLIGGIALPASFDGADLDDRGNFLDRFSFSATFSSRVFLLHDGGVLLRPFVLEFLTEETKRAAEAGLRGIVVVVLGGTSGRSEENSSGDFGGGSVSEAVGAGSDSFQEITVEEERDGEGDNDPLRDDRVSDESRPAAHELIEARERVRRRGKVGKTRGRLLKGSGHRAIDRVEVECRDNVHEKLGARLVR